MDKEKERGTRREGEVDFLAIYLYNNLILLFLVYF